MVAEEVQVDVLEEQLGSGQADLKPAFQPILLQIAEVLKQRDGHFIISGHTDDIPIETRQFRSNWDLSAKRAASVVHFFIQQGDIDPERMRNVLPIGLFPSEGDIDEPSGHMRYPGTISVRQETFEMMLTDVARSLEAHGFTDIVFIGDSGGEFASWGGGGRNGGAPPSDIDDMLIQIAMGGMAAEEIYVVEPTAEGQREIIESYGVTEDFVGCPIKSSMEVVQVSTVEPKSCMIMICFLVLPPDIGITEAPIFSAP